MKLDPVLIDSRNYFGRPSYGFPWSRLGERPRIHVPYERFQNVSEDFWEPIVPRSSNEYHSARRHDPVSYQGNHRQDARVYEERSIPITVDRNPRSLSKQERKYQYNPYDIDDEEEQIKLACRLSLANQNNNGTDVRRRQSHSGSRNHYEPSELSMSQSPVHQDVIEIEDDDDEIAPPPPPRTTSLVSNSRISNQNGTYRNNTRGDKWNLSDDSDSETVISLVQVTPKVTRHNAERNPSVPSRHFFIGSSDESDLEDLHLSGKNYAEDSRRSGKSLSYDFYKGMEKQDEDFCKLMRVESGNKGEVTLKPNDINITPCPSYPAYRIIREIISREGRQVDYIHGDGNCFFRALSKIIYGSESCHEEIRQAVVDIMEKYPKEFEQFIDTGSTREHIKNMRKLGTWGTQAEIYGAATLLQRDVYILSPDHTGENYRWLLFSPRFLHDEGIPYHNCYLTLCHTNGNHYDRIAPLHGDCNCHLSKPRMSGIRAQIDLTYNEIV